MDFFALTMLITVFQEGVGLTDTLLSAFCGKCAERRGEPKLVRVGDQEVHQWVNPCGHQDGQHEILFEIELQCQNSWCVLMFSETHFPFCGAECQQVSEHPVVHVSHD